MSIPYHHNLAFIYQALRKYELGAEQLHKLLQLEPAFAPAHELLAFSYSCMGRYQEAFAELDEQGPLVATDLRNLRARGLRGTVNAVAGRHIEARRVLGELRELSEPPDFKTAYDCAAIHAASMKPGVKVRAMRLTIGSKRSAKLSTRSKTMG